LQEDVVERRPRHGDSPDADVTAIEAADDLRDRARAILDVEGERVGLGHHALEPGQVAHRRLGGCGVGAIERERVDVRDCLCLALKVRRRARASIACWLGAAIG
jgi:hypothetical protein